MGVLKNIRRGWSRIQADRYEHKQRELVVKRAREEAFERGRLEGAKKAGYRAGVEREMRGHGSRIGHALDTLSKHVELGPAFRGDPFFGGSTPRKTTRRKKKRRH